MAISQNSRSPVRHSIVLVAIPSLVVVAMGVIGVALYLRSAADESDRNRIRGAEFYLLYYARHYDHLPPACLRDANGKPLSSWRFAAVMRAVTEIEAEPPLGWPTTEQAWNSNQNALLRNSFLHSESSQWACYIDPTRPGGMARFAAITGPGTAFDEKAPCGIYADTSSSTARPTLVPPQTILFVEIRNSTKHWMEPGGDLDIRTMDHTVGRGTGNDPSGVYPEGFWVAFADGRCWYLSNDTPFDVLAKFFTIDSAKEYVRRKALGRYLRCEVTMTTTLLPASPSEER